MYLLSIIVPVYKTEKFLNKCVDSILKQTVSDIEIILVDDGSPDNCGKICDEYAENNKNIKVIHKNNQGLAAARVTGLKAATGKYFTFVDSDDWVGPNMYGEMLKTAQQQHADVVAAGFLRDFGGRTEVYNNDIVSGTYTGNTLEKFFEKALFDVSLMRQGLAPSVWSKIFCRETMLESFLKRTDRVNFAEDTLFTFTALFRAKCVVVINELHEYHYMINEESITRSYYKNQINDLNVVYDRLMTECELAKKSTKVKKCLAFNYIHFFLLGIAQEFGRTNKSDYVYKYKRIKKFAREMRAKEFFTWDDFVCFDKEDQTKLKLLFKEKTFYLILYLFWCAFKNRLINR